MFRPIRLVLLCGLAGCAGPLNSKSTATSPAAPDDVFECVQLQLKALRYYRVQYDTDDRWIRSQKVDSTGVVSSGLFRRTYDKMEVKVHPDAAGNSGIEFLVSTTNEFATAAGNRQEEVAASDGVKRDAATVAQACTTPAASGT